MSRVQNIITSLIASYVVIVCSGCGGGSGDSGNALLSGDPQNSSSGGAGSSTTSSGGGTSSSSSSGGTQQLSRNYAALVEWDIPNARENGQDLSLSDIGGYEISYRLEQSGIPVSVIVQDNNTDEYILENLAPGRYEVRIAVYDTDNIYSNYSSPAYADIGL